MTAPDLTPENLARIARGCELLIYHSDNLLMEDETEEVFSLEAYGMVDAPFMAALIAEVERLRAASKIYRDASFQGHSTHWDSSGRHGAGCPECIRASELRARADKLLEPTP